MDYADYLENQIQERYELADKMDELGFETEEEYMQYMDDMAELAADRMFEDQRLQEE